MQETDTAPEPAGTHIAVISEGLYLLNLLFPLLPLLGLGWIYSRHRKHETALVRIHLRQAFFAALLSTCVFLAANLLILALGASDTRPWDIQKSSLGR